MKKRIWAQRAGYDISQYWSQVDNVAPHSWGLGKLREQAICVGPQPCLVSSKSDVFQDMYFILLASLETEAQRNWLADYKVSQLVNGRVRVPSGRLALGCDLPPPTSWHYSLFLPCASPVPPHLIIWCLFPCSPPRLPYPGLSKRCYGIMSGPEGESKYHVGPAQTAISLSLLPPAGET